MRVEDHPILGKMEDRKEVTIFYNEKPIKAFEGEPIASALMAADCMMVVDGIPNTRTCVTMVKDGMKVETQKGLARISRHKD